MESIDAIREAVRELERAGYIVRSRERNEKGQLKGTDYVIYEQPHIAVVPPVSEKPPLENPMLDNPAQEKPILDTPALGKPMQENPTQLNNNISITNPVTLKVLNTMGSYPYQSNDGSYHSAAGRIRKDGVGYDEAKKCREIVKENIEYKYIESRFSGDKLDEIVDLVVETLCSTKPNICVSGNDYPTTLVKEKFLRLNRMHIEYVFECLDKNTTYIRNIKKYLLATLFNAPSTIDTYYSALVNHDIYGDGSRGR